MRNRMTLALASIVVVIVAASSVSIQTGSAQTTAQPKAQAKADECLARPGATAPKGSHWFYRLERPSGKRCWYLGAANQRVVRERAARTERAVPTPTPAPAELRADEQTRAEQPRAEPPVAVATETNATATTTARSDTQFSSVAATQFSAAWPIAPKAAATGAHEVPTVGSQEGGQGNSEANVAAAEAQPENTGQVLPVMSATGRSAAQPSESPPGVIHLVIFLSAIAAFVAIAFRAVLKLAASRRERRDRRPMARPAGPIIRTRAPELRAAEPSIEAMSEPAIARLREIAQRWDTPVRVPRQPRPTAQEVEPNYEVEGPALRRRRVA